MDCNSRILTSPLDWNDIDTKTEIWRWSKEKRVFYLDKKTQDELKDDLRAQRKWECFPFINRGQLWYDSLTDAQRKELSEWYRAWLNATETMEAPTKPDWLE